MNENQEIKRTSKSHLKALVKKGREQAQKEKEADDRDRAERAIRRKTRQGSNYDPSEDDLEDSYTPEGEETLNENEEMSPEVQRAGQKITKWLKGRKAQEPVRKLARKLTIGDQGTFLYGRDKVRINPPPRNPVNSSYEPEGETTLSEFDSSTTEFVDRVMNRVNEGFAEMSERQRKDYDKKAKKPMHGREASQEERKKMAAKFKESRGGASTKTKKMRDLRNP